MPIGHIWPVREEWGKKRFFEIDSHYDYGYKIPRHPKVGDILVFYSNMELLGGIPVDVDDRLVTSEDRRCHPQWVSDWKYVVGLDGTRKEKFEPPIRIGDIAYCIAILKEKENLHAVCRNAPKITMNEYNILCRIARKSH